MSDLSTQMNIVKVALAAMFPLRIVTRDLLDFSMRKQSELKSGIYTVLSSDEGGYSNNMGREAAYGRHNIMILGQLKLAENVAPHEVEDAEGVMIDEIKALMRNVPAGINALILKRWRQSQQMESPFGWVMFELEMMGG